MVLVLLFTFFTVKTVAPNLFMADSPRINPVFISDVINTPRRFLSSLSNFRLFNFGSPSAPEVPVEQNRVANIEVDPAEIAKVRQVTPPPNVIFKEILKGV